MPHNYQSFAELPEGLQKRVSKITHPDEAEWVHKKVPALDNQSFLECLNGNDGYARVSAYLTKVEGYFC